MNRLPEITKNAEEKMENVKSEITTQLSQQKTNLVNKGQKIKWNN